VFQRTVERLQRAGGTLELGVQVTRVTPLEEGRIAVMLGARREVFDKVLFTGPVNVMRQVADPALVEAPQSAGRDVEYLGVICMVVVSRKPLTPYYVLNISDESVPFTGVIGVSTVVDPAETNGFHLTYLPKYVLSDDPLLSADDASIRKSFLDGLRRMYPDIDAADIVSVHINRAMKVQPLQVIDYSSIAPRAVTKHPNFFVLNSAQFLNNTLNNNEVIRNVNAFFAAHGDQFKDLESRAAAEAPLRATA
jgi:protoporphyrinogen oxidase